MSAPTTIHSSVSTPRSSLTYDQTVLNTFPSFWSEIPWSEIPRSGRSLRAGQTRDLPTDRVDGGDELALERARVHRDADGHDERADDDPFQRLDPTFIVHVRPNCLEHVPLLLLV